LWLPGFWFLALALASRVVVLQRDATVSSGTQWVSGQQQQVARARLNTTPRLYPAEADFVKRLHPFQLVVAPRVVIVRLAYAVDHGVEPAGRNYAHEHRGAGMGQPRDDGHRLLDSRCSATQDTAQHSLHGSHLNRWTGERQDMRAV